MTNEERELNERIARWIWPDAALHWADDDGLTRELNGPLYVANITFTRSLDAQAAHVWPKLDGIRITKNPESEWGMEILKMDSDGLGHKEYYPVFAATPAWAAARAVGKLVYPHTP